MQTTKEALENWDVINEPPLHYHRKLFNQPVEIAIEPLLNGMAYLAIYDLNGNLLTPKIPIKPGL